MRFRVIGNGHRPPMGGAPYKSAKEGVGTFWMLLYLTTKENPCHVYRLNTLKLGSTKIIGQTITYSGATSGFEVKSWRHTALWMAACKHSLAHSAVWLLCDIKGRGRGQYLMSQWCYLRQKWFGRTVTFNLNPPKTGSPRNESFWNIWTHSEKYVPTIG